MGKVVMPKNSALLEEIEPALQIYYEADGWLDNAAYKEKLKEIIGGAQYESSYTKKAQIIAYFGFVIWEDIDNEHSRRKITPAGRKMYKAIQNGNEAEIQNVLMSALETVKFGRDNYGCTSSDSDVEPPALFIRAILDMGYLTYKEFAFLLWKLADEGANYTDTIMEVKASRSQNDLVLDDAAQNYMDCKPIMALVRWGFLKDDSSTSDRPQHIVVAPEVMSKYRMRLRNLKIYNIDFDIRENQLFEKTEAGIIGGVNILYYGVPGSGKSYKINQQIDDFSKMERVVFHPDYTYSDFVGQILPQLVDVEGSSEKKLAYEFVPGPFTRMLKKAITDTENMYYLVIEEINRGNAPAIFGEIFQLLDRLDTGEGEYAISNCDVALEIYGDKNHPIKMPANLSIFATMNTADQNVFTLDTAFQRRWDMQQIRNDVDAAGHAAQLIEGSQISWGTFADVINEEIIEANEDMISSEDKRLGAYFVKPDELSKDRFPQKALKYLWDDAFKMDRGMAFADKNSSLEQVLYSYEKAKGDPLQTVLRAELYQKMLAMAGKVGGEDDEDPDFEDEEQRV